MKLLKNFNRDSLFQVKLILIENSYEYVLCSANDSDEHYAVLTESEVEE